MGRAKALVTPNQRRTFERAIPRNLISRDRDRQRSDSRRAVQVPAEVSMRRAIPADSGAQAPANETNPVCRQHRKRVSSRASA